MTAVCGLVMLFAQPPKTLSELALLALGCSLSGVLAVLAIRYYWRHR